MFEKFKFLVVLVLIVFIIPLDIFSQEYAMGSRLYKQENGKWYNYYDGIKCDQIVPNRLIVRMSSKLKPTNNNFEKLGIANIKVNPKRYTGGYYVINIEKEEDSFMIANKIYQSIDYDYVEFDSYVSFCSIPQDIEYDSNQWNLYSNRLDMPHAWDISIGNSSIILAFIDSGFDIDHEDLDGNFWINPGETSGDEIDNDNNGFVDDIHGWHFGGGDWREGGPGNNNLSIDEGHGTNVLGIATAQTNNYEGGEYVGIAGIAGGWANLKGVSAMLLATENSEYDDTDDSTYLTSIVDCITYAMKNGADVINMSFNIKYEDGYDYVKAVIDTAVDEYDCVCVAATGNDGGAVKFPANYDKVIAVGSVDSDDKHDYTPPPNQSGSCWDVDGTTNGKEIDLVAPTNVYTTSMSDGYLGFGNTSASVPHVSALAALILSINDDLQPSDVRDILTSSTDTDIYDNDGNPISYDANGWNQFVGYGRINAYKALKKTIEEYGGVGGTFTFNNDLTIQSDDTLTIDPGSTVEFYPGKRLIVKGTLIADSITFTKYSTSNWGGISFNNANSNSVIENCTITNADTGIVLVNSDITIKNNEIYNNYYYGIYSYNSSRLIETNEIYNISVWYGIYAYNGNPTITDNYIHDISDEGIAINGSGSGTYLRHNSIINCEGGVLLFGNNSVNLRGGSGTYGGYNTIEYYDDGPGTYGIKITGGEPNLGEYYPTACRGYNNFIYDGRDIVYNSTGSEIMAEKNYWGGSPQASWFTGSVAYDFPLSSPVTTAGSSLEKPVLLSDDRQLLVTASELLDAKSYAEATEIYKQLIEQYPYSFYASLALGRAMAAYRLEDDLLSQRSYLKGLTEHPNPKVVNKAILWLASIESWSGNRAEAEKIVISTDIKDTLGIEMRLNWANDLVNVYNDTKSAEEVFSELLNSEPNEGTIATIEAIRATAPGFKTDHFFKEISQQDRMSLPAEYKLGDAYPNPFNPSTTIDFDIPESGQVNIQVYDITGRLVSSLLNDYKEAGSYKVIFDGTNLSSGLYIYRMMINDFYSQKKMLLIK